MHIVDQAMRNTRLGGMTTIFAIRENILHERSGERRRSALPPHRPVQLVERRGLQHGGAPSPADEQLGEEHGGCL